jgi:hypothetical protein
VVLAERHGTSVAVLRSLNPDLLIDASAPLPVGSWLFIPRRRTTTPVTAAISSAAAAAVVLYTPETLAAHLGVTLATLENWRLSGYGPSWFQLGELIRYSATDVDAWLALQFEQAQG